VSVSFASKLLLLFSVASYFFLEPLINLTSHLLQSEHVTNDDQWKVTETNSEDPTFSPQGEPGDKKAYTRCQG
jgi:hypothetical protein